MDSTQQLPNVLFILADQLCADALPLFGETQIQTPHISRLANGGVSFRNAISTFPVCTPYRSMLLTGRHPQTTGHLVNNICTRHSEISIADAFAAHGYRTGYVGKWHLHRGSYPADRSHDWVPAGRDRLGFQFWRAYNHHMVFFDGPISHDGDWLLTPQYQDMQWKGYETLAMAGYAREFLEQSSQQPFLLFVSPHQPHSTPFRHAPDEYYARVPGDLRLPGGCDPSRVPLDSYRKYLAMVLAIDDMVGIIVADLRRLGLLDNTLIVFTSDHGTQLGRHGIRFWDKRSPYEESIRVPLILHQPDRLPGGRWRDALTAPVDLFPSLCGLCGVSIPCTVEGHDLSPAWLGREGAFEPEAVLTMNFSADYGCLQNGREWRGVRTRRHSYARWLDSRVVLYDLQADPREANNLAGQTAQAELEARMESLLMTLLAARSDRFEPALAYRSWFDDQRRVVRNAFGPLPHPESQPDWSLLS